MAGFLRRKSATPAAEPNKGPSTPPIFARLATSLTSSGQRPRNATSSLKSHVAVSQPMTLGSTSLHHAVTPSRTSGEDVNIRHSRHHDALGTPRQGAQAEINEQTNAYSPPSGPQQAQVSRAASAAATTTPQRQAARLSRRVPALEDKPLPVPVPDDDPPPGSNEQTPLTQRSLVSRLSHRAPPSQPTTSPPSAYGIRAQQLYKDRRVSIDSARQVQENSVFDQRRSTLMSPPDPGSAFHQPLAPSPNFSQRRRMDDIRPSPRAEVNAGQHDLTSGSARGTVVSRHTIKPPHQTGNQQRNADDVSHRATSVDEHVPSAYTLREEESRLESKVDIPNDPAPSSGQKNSYRSVSPTHIHANGLGNTNGKAVHHDTNLDRPLPSRPVTDGQDSDNENGDVFVDAAEEINSERRAQEVSPEITLYRDYSTNSLPSPSSSPDPGIPSIAEGQLSITQTPPLQAHKSPLVTKGGDSMGAIASFPDPQSSSPSKSGLRQKHIATTLTEGHKMRNGYHPQDYYNPYQDLGSTPQLMHTVNHVRGKPLIFAAMEANIDQQQPGEEQKVSVRLWDGQDGSIGPNMHGYMTSPALQDHKFADGATQNVAAGYPSPPSSEFSYPRAGKVDASQESSRKSSGTPTKSRKLSKARHSSIDTRHASRPSTPAKVRPLTPVSASSPATPAKTRPLTPVSPGSARKSIAGNGLSAPAKVHVSLENEEPQLSVPSSRRGIRNSGMALLDVGEDPFAMTEGVRMVTPSLATQEKETREKEKEQEKDKEPRRSKARYAEMSQEGFDDGNVRLRKRTSIDNDGDGVPLVNHVKSDAKSEQSIDRDEGRISRSKEPEAKKKSDVGTRPFSTVSPDSRPKSRETSDINSRSVPFPLIDKRKFSFHFVEFIANTSLLGELLTYLSFYEWCTLASISKHIRTTLVETGELKEVVLERFLRTVGYVKWCWDGPDPLPLSLQDLSDYMFGVSTPTHEYGRVADLYVRSLSLHPTQRDPALYDMVRRLTAATRSYSRIVLRLRAHAEKEAASRTLSSVAGRTGNSRPPSRASSPAHSSFSHGHSQNGQPNSAGFRSPLFRLKRAPLLRVFVPSPDGDWLSDKSVLECEAECRRAGIMDMIRFGDVVWDTAVGDEGNVGKLIWDGSYLIDLDYSYSPVGDLPKYMPALAFPPSYFHKVIRTGPHFSNPIVHVDLSQWGEQIAANLQLLQDRVRTETPQGAIHNVIRWVNRSSFVIRPPSNSTRMRGSPTGPQASLFPRIPIPDTHVLFVDPGWYGTVIVETEGTDESLADLQERCGPGVFPPRAKGVAGQMGINPAADARKVFRILRERSRPGEIWIRAVSIKEKVLM